MQSITRSKTAINLAEYVKRSAKEADFLEIIREPTQLFDEETGELVAIYDFLPPEARELPAALKGVDYPETERTGGLKTTSRIFGYMPRIALRSDFCRMAGLAKDSPQANALLLKWGGEAEAIYRRYAPERYAKHAELTAKVLGEYRMGGTVFTSGIVNKNNPLKYHFDSGNFDGVFSCMLGFKSNIAGGGTFPFRNTGWRSRSAISPSRCSTGSPSCTG